MSVQNNFLCRENLLRNPLLDQNSKQPSVSSHVQKTIITKASTDKSRMHIVKMTALVASLCLKYIKALRSFCFKEVDIQQNSNLFHSQKIEVSSTSGLPQGFKSSATYAGLSSNFCASAFQDIDSSVLKSLSSTGKIVLVRKDFFGLAEKFPPPLIGKSDFVSKAMVEHLMRHKKNSALGVKYVPGDQITNMEGAVHTFVTPVARILMTGDYTWVGKLQGQPFGKNRVREVILSAAIHPDFECDTVVMPLVKLKDQAVIGKPLDKAHILFANLKKDSGSVLAEYEDKLLKHMIYHLSPTTHELPASTTIARNQIMSQGEAQVYLEKLIQNPSLGQKLQGKFMRNGKEIISLEILYQIYVHQVRNEFKILNANAPQGYVYTISPPSIFAKKIGGAAILNRLQALAFQSLISEKLFSNLKTLAFSDYADKPMIPLFKKIFPNVEVVSTKKLFTEDGNYKMPEKCALVLHNNGDGFGQNIETEGPSSMDGVIGSYSNAASVLKRDRSDLVDFVC